MRSRKSRIAYAYYMYHYIIFLTTDSLGGTPWVFAPSPSTARSQRSLKASTRSACRIVDSSRRLTFRDSHSACSTVAASKETSKPWPDHQPERQGHSDTTSIPHQPLSLPTKSELRMGIRAQKWLKCCKLTSFLPYVTFVAFAGQQA